MEALAQHDTDLAERLLWQLMQADPMHAGAWLDLAWLYCQTGKRSAAEALWEEVMERFAPPPDILALIALQKSQACSLKAPSTRLEPVDLALSGVRVALGRGYTSNANQGVSNLQVELLGPSGTVRLELLPQYAARGDHYTHWAVEAQRLWGGDRGRTAYAYWQGLHHDREQNQNTQDLALGFVQAWSLEDWRGRLQLQADTTLLGGRPSRYHAQTRWMAYAPWRPLGEGQVGVGGHIGWQHYPRLDRFDAWEWGVRTQWGMSHGSSRTAADLGWTWNQGTSQRPGGNRSGLHLGVEWRHPGGTWRGYQWMAEASWRVQRWHDQTPYAPGLIEQVRQQSTSHTTATVGWSAQTQTHWMLRVQHVRHLENIGLFSHTGTSLQLTWNRRWDTPVTLR
jgi:hypothetical protein